MIAADTSVLIDHINGIENAFVTLLAQSIEHKKLWLSPAVITELYGIKSNPNQIWSTLAEDIPLLEIYDGYWDRAGKNRQKLLKNKHKARQGDTLIAQSCIDHNVPLLTRDVDYKHFAKHCGLQLIKPP